MNFPSCDLSSERSAEAATVVSSCAVLLESSGSVVVDDTVASLVTDGAAAGPTFTTIENSELAPAARGSACVHVTSWSVAEQSQSVPSKDTKVRPSGSVSVTVTGPAASEGPVLFTVTV